MPHLPAQNYTPWPYWAFLPVQSVPMPIYGGLFASAKCPHAHIWGPFCLCKMSPCPYMGAFLPIPQGIYFGGGRGYGVGTACVFDTIHQLCIIPIQNKPMLQQFRPHGPVHWLMVVVWAPIFKQQMHDFLDKTQNQGLSSCRRTKCCTVQTTFPFSKKGLVAKHLHTCCNQVDMVANSFNP